MMQNIALYALYCINYVCLCNSCENKYKVIQINTNNNDHRGSIGISNPR